MARNGDEQFYKYTKTDYFISKTQRDFYEKNGYLIMQKLVDDELLEECKQRFLDICNDKVDLRPLLVMKDLSLRSKNLKGEFLIYKIQDFPYDDVLFKYISYKPLVDIVSSIIGPNITTFNNMIINKPPNAERDTSRHPLHQDLHYFTIRPANSIVAAWTAMEHIDEKNGSLFVVPGSHKEDLKHHEYPHNVKNKAFHGVVGFDDVPIVNLVMEKGDTVFFHPLLMHGSGPNLTKGFRKAISSHYADSNCHFINLRGTDQEHVMREVVEMYSRSFGANAKDEDILKLKSRLVRGPSGNFQKQSSQL